MKLSRVERWLLVNQFAIVEKLHPEEASSYAEMSEVLRVGYELHYDWIVEHIYSDVMTSVECKEVLDILDMFGFLRRAYEGLSDKSGVDDRWVKFHGFDGNNEGRYLSYVHFLVERQGKFQGLERGDNFNSHMPVLSIYRGMLERWNVSKDRYNLTREDVIRIVPDTPA
jgi:uncharacterized protein YfbU (UPF0304 family)